MTSELSNLYLAALSKSPGGVLIINSAMQIEFINDWLLMAISAGNNTSDAKTSAKASVIDFLPQAENPRFLNAVKGALEKGVATKLSATFDTNLLKLHDPMNGKPLSHSTNVSPLGTTEQKYCLVNVLDETKPLKREKLLADSINKLKETEVQLHESRDVALKASKARGDFIALVSHQLRTPLNAIVGFSELLSTGALGELNEEQLDSAKQIFDAGSLLSDFVAQILMISDYSDCALVEVQPVSLGRETNNALNSYRSGQTPSPINIELDASVNSTVEFETDLRLLQSLLKNLFTIATACQDDELVILTVAELIDEKPMQTLIFKGKYKRVQLQYCGDEKRISQLSSENSNTDMDMTFLLELSHQLASLLNLQLTYCASDGIRLILSVEMIDSVG